MEENCIEINLDELHENGQVFCAVCRWTGKKFLVYNGNPGALCPVCWSAGRHRGEVLWLSENSNVFENRMRVLHFAPEKCLHSIISKHSNIDYVSVDIRKGEALIRGDITDLLFKDEVFDAIICNHILEHVEEDHKAIRELFRVLKPGGWVLISYPIYAEKTFENFSITSKEERERVFKQHDHVRLCGMDYHERLRDVGFETEFHDYNEYSEEEKHILGLTNIPNSAFYVCRKK